MPASHQRLYDALAPEIIRAGVVRRVEVGEDKNLHYIGRRVGVRGPVSIRDGRLSTPSHNCLRYVWLFVYEENTWLFGFCPDRRNTNDRLQNGARNGPQTTQLHLCRTGDAAWTDKL